MTKPVLSDVRRYCLSDIAAVSALLANLPEVSGAITKTYEFKVRVTLALNRHTEQLLAARTGSTEQRGFLRELAAGARLEHGDAPMTVVGLCLREEACRMFRRELGVVALLHFRLSYSAHRAYTGRELRKALAWIPAHTRYSAQELRVDMLDNS